MTLSGFRWPHLMCIVVLLQGSIMSALENDREQPDATTEAGAGENLLINGGFSTGLAPWGWDQRYIQAAGAEAWTSFDANGSPSSGSAFLTVAQAGRARQLLQCVRLAGGQVYEFGARVYFPSGQANEGRAVIGYVEYASPDCSGTFTGFGVLQYLPSTTKNIWQQMRAKPPLAPTAGSMQVIIGPLLSTPGTLSAYFDDAYVTIVPASVVVSAQPEALIQQPGQGGVSTTYTLTNVGEVPTTVTLAQQGSFFSQTPASFILQPRGNQVITVSTFAQAAGAYNGASIPSGDGIPAGTAVPIRLAVVASSGAQNSLPAENRVDVSAPENVLQFDGSIEFSNPGTGTLRGTAASDVPWIVPSPNLVTIEPGGKAAVPFRMDRSLRSNEERIAGSATGSLFLRYLTDAAAKSGEEVGPLDTSTSGSASTTMKDSLALAINLNDLPALDDSVVLFLPGVGHAQGSVGTFISDLSIAASKKIGLSSRLDIYYTPTGASSGSLQLSRDLIPDQLLNLADIVNSYFGRDGETGTLQLRTLQPDLLAIGATVFNKSNAAGTYGTAIPVLRSDRSLRVGETSYLTGLAGRSTSTHTNMILQETAGHATRVDLSFLSASGSPVGDPRIVDLAPFSVTRLEDAVPPGAVSATLRNRFDSTGRFLAYATPVDKALELDGTRKGGDTWVVADWPQILKYARSKPVIIPVAGVASGANNTLYRTDISVMNTGDREATGRISFRAPGLATVVREVRLGAQQTAIYANVLQSLFGITTNQTGYLIFEPVSPASAPWLLSARIYATVGQQVATFGTGIPALALTSAMINGQTRRFSGFDDSGEATIQARRPATFRSNLGLVETAGKAVRVRATLYNVLPEGSTALASVFIFKDFDLAPGEFRLISRIANEILGSRRNQYRSDLRDLYLDVAVVSGEGAVVTFLSSIDNGTADQIIQVP